VIGLWMMKTTKLLLWRSRPKIDKSVCSYHTLEYWI